MSDAAEQLQAARLARLPIEQDALAPMPGAQEAYAVQQRGIGLRIGAGEKPRGVKMGFTSRAKMAQMGVHEMIIGQLTDAMEVEDGGSLRRGDFIHPRVEPEIAFLLGRDLLPGAGSSEWMRCVDAVAPALEIIDSRFRGFRFDLAAVVADNTSAAAFVVGAWRAVPARIDNLGLCMHVGAAQPVAGSTAAILGNPWRALAAAALLANRHGIRIPAGAVVLAGAATAAEPLPAHGLVEAEVAHLGRVAFRIEA